VPPLETVSLTPCSNDRQGDAKNIHLGNHYERNSC
jgi:hypothetical protein